MQKKYHKQKGFAAAVTLLLAAVLAVLSYKIIFIGRISINVAKEKQALDACSLYAGIKIIETNDIENICSLNFFNECTSYLEDVNINGEMVCTDQGLTCNIDNECERIIYVSSTYNPGLQDVTKSVKVHVKEDQHDVDLVDAAVILLLDYSGSMNGNRIIQLKNTVNQFITSSFNLSYSVILYNNNIISFSNINKGQQHDNFVSNIVNNHNPGGGTNFINPIQKAMEQIQTTNYEAYYILLVSDGQPNEGINQSKTYVENNILSISDRNCVYSTRTNPCITVYTLGVDNANTSALHAISGNAISQDPLEFSYMVNANQTEAAFNSILEEIICRVGPIETNNQKVYVFHEDFPIIEGEDFVFDYDTKIIKFYDFQGRQVCTDIIDGRNNIIIRWGQPKLEVLE